MSVFQLSPVLQPRGDQPQAIAKLVEGYEQGLKHQVLMGVTGSGKTFTMAHTIAALGLPAIIIAPNKTLAAQLFQEFKVLFPENAVEFFISYYDYYQPEAYLPSSDTYIAKDSSINDDIDKMRHAATQALFQRRDVIIVASVSCIYGLGSPESYASLVVKIASGQELARDEFLRSLVEIQFSRNDKQLMRGHFRVRGDSVDVMPANNRDEAIRVSFFGDELESIQIIDAVTGRRKQDIDELALYPNSHYVTDRKDRAAIIKEILHDLGTRLRELKAQGKLLEYQRLEQRVMQDVEMMEQLGWCSGIENYSRYLTGGKAGAPPPTLLNYFPEDFLTILDESHITAPQIRGMYRGDRSRKQVLVDYGFRLPAALDNRPLNFEEFLNRTTKLMYVSATPGPYEIGAAGGRWVEQVIRPTGLVDPIIEVRSSDNQIDHLFDVVKSTIADQGRVLITTLTKRMAEDLTEYFVDHGIKTRYLHADIESLERHEIIRGLRQGQFDVLVGINLLREGLDLPEVKFVAVMDADKEGFLRSRSSLIQIVGRAARNAESRVLFYANRTTDAMRECIDETNRRRAIQIQHNETHNITPQTIIKEMPKSLRALYGLESSDDIGAAVGGADMVERGLALMKQKGLNSIVEVEKHLKLTSKQMQKEAGELNFEKAAELRDEVDILRALTLHLSGSNSLLEDSNDS